MASKTVSKKAPKAKKKTAAAAKRARKPKPKAVAKAKKATKTVKAKTTKKVKVKAVKKAAVKSRKTVRAAASSKKAAPRAKVTAKRAAPRATKAKPARSAASSPPSGGNRRHRQLSGADVEQFHHMLLEKRAQILGDVSTLSNEALDQNRSDASGDLSSMPIHMADLGSDNYELEFTLGLIEGERAILREIDEALERVRDNTYGACLATGQPIGKARLRAKPWAKYCYEYTLAQERGQNPGF